jgi:hypothetical protein
MFGGKTHTLVEVSLDNLIFHLLQMVSGIKDRSLLGACQQKENTRENASRKEGI